MDSWQKKRQIIYVVELLFLGNNDDEMMHYWNWNLSAVVLVGYVSKPVVEFMTVILFTSLRNFDILKLCTLFCWSLSLVF